MKESFINIVWNLVKEAPIRRSISWKQNIDIIHKDTACEDSKTHAIKINYQVLILQVMADKNTNWTC